MNLCILDWSENNMNGHGIVSAGEQCLADAGINRITCLYFAGEVHRQRNSEADGIAIFSRRPGRRKRAGLSLLRWLNRPGMVPSACAGIPLSWCEAEILEALLACDPDIVAMPHLRWSEPLKRMISRAYPQWTCVREWNRDLVVEDNWRRFHPGSAKVSIVLPTYNGSRFLAQSIESCLNQTVENLELLVVDDGSAEDVYSTVRRFDDPRLRYLKHEKNKGVAEALNTGFRNSTGDYLTWTSDDNYYVLTALEEMLRFLQTYSEIDFVYADSFVIGERTGAYDRSFWRGRPPGVLRAFNGITPCFLYKRRVYETIGDYSSECFLAEDYDYWVRISRRFRMQRLFKPLYYYRCHPGSLTETYGSQVVARQARAVRERNAD